MRHSQGNLRTRQDERLTTVRAWLSPGRVSLSAVLPLSLVTDAALSAADNPGLGMLSGDSVLRVVGSLLLVFGCLFGVLYLLKRLNRLPVGEQRPLRVLASLKVGTREKVLLLESGNSQLLVGVAAGSVRTLHVLQEKVQTGAETPDTFESLLQQTSLGSQR